MLLLSSWSHNCSKMLLEQLMIIMSAAYIPWYRLPGLPLTLKAVKTIAVVRKAWEQGEFFYNLLFFYKFLIRWCAANLQVWIDTQLWSGWKRTVWGQYYGWRKISYAAFLFIDCWLFSLTACGGWQLGGHQLCHQGSKGGAHKCSPSVFHCRRSEHYEVS